MTVNELNTIVIIKHYQSSQDAITGKVSSALIGQWDKWAKVEQTSGSRVLDNAAITYKETYKITMRYENTRPTLENYKLEYKGRDLIIHDVLPVREGQTWWEELTAFTQV